MTDAMQIALLNLETAVRETWQPGRVYLPGAGETTQVTLDECDIEVVTNALRELDAVRAREVAG